MWAILCLFVALGVSQLNSADAQALATICTQMSAPSFLANWSCSNTFGTGPCGPGGRQGFWQGLYCSGPAGNQQINSLTLDTTGKSVSVAVPSGLGDFTNLNYFSLTGLGWSGIIGPWIGGLATAKGFYSMIISQTSISGTLPAEIGLLTTLVGVEISNSPMTGSLQPLSQLPLLQSLFLHNCSFCGSVPVLASSLLHLDISNNPCLNGSISLKGSAVATAGGWCNTTQTSVCADVSCFGSVPQRGAFCGVSSCPASFLCPRSASLVTVTSSGFKVDAFWLGVLCFLIGFVTDVTC